MSLAKVVSLFAALVFSFSTFTARAQTPVRILSGYPPGGAVDTLARVFGEKIAEAIGRPVVVENRPGAAGQIASEALKAAAPDGNTLMVAPDSSMTLYPHTVKKPAYDTLADFAPVAHVGSYPIGFGVNAGIPAGDLREWVIWAKASPNNATYGSGAYGSTLHFMGLMLGQATGVALLHVPYRGVGPAITDVIAGQLPAVMQPLGTLLAQARAGKIRILAHSGSRRSSGAPDVPTFKELGYPTLEVAGWFGMFAPAGIRPEVVARYNEIVVQATRTPVVRERMRSLDLEIREMAPAEISAMLKFEYDRWGPIVRASGFSADSQ
jgi:tripartite-type tricarboxylate transporter receptor subunit TctC